MQRWGSKTCWIRSQYKIRLLLTKAVTSSGLSKDPQMVYQERQYYWVGDVKLIEEGREEEVLEVRVSSRGRIICNARKM